METVANRFRSDSVKELDRLRKRMVQIESERDWLLGWRGKLKDREQEVEAYAEEITQKLDQLQDENTALKDRVTHLEAELVETRSKHEERELSFHQRFARMDAEMAEMRQRMTQLETELDQGKSRNLDLTSENRVLKDRLKELEDKAQLQVWIDSVKSKLDQSSNPEISNLIELYLELVESGQWFPNISDIGFIKANDTRLAHQNLWKDFGAFLSVLGYRSKWSNLSKSQFDRKLSKGISHSLNFYPSEFIQGSFVRVGCPLKIRGMIVLEQIFSPSWKVNYLEFVSRYLNGECSSLQRCIYIEAIELLGIL